LIRETNLNLVFIAMSISNTKKLWNELNDLCTIHKLKYLYINIRSNKD